MPPPTSDPLRRSIRLPHATAMVVGTIIGAAIFVQPSEVTGRMPHVWGVMAVWLVSGVLTLLGALITAELASRFTRSGGVYVFLRESYAPVMGFLWAWAMFWVMHTGIIAAIATVFARYAAFFFPLDEDGIRIVAVVAILVLSGVNYVGVRHGTLLQTWFTAVKLLAIALIILVGLAFAGGADPAAVAVAADAAPLPSELSLADFGLALVAGLFAFGGWHMVTYAAEETVEPERTIPRALVIGTLVVTACYIALNAVYLRILPLEVVASSTRVAADAADALFGFGGGAALSSLVMFSTFGALSGIVLAGPRVYYAMSQDGLLFRGLGAVHPRFGTPHRAIVLQAIWAVVLVLTGTYRALFTRVIYTEWIFFGLMALGLLRIRRGSAAPGESYRNHPLVPLVFAGSAFAVVVNQVISDPVDSFVGLGLVLLGLPVYAVWVRLPPSPEAS